MDKAKVITAYMKGFITLKECEQILGMDSTFIQEMVYTRIKGDQAASKLRTTANP